MNGVSTNGVTADLYIYIYIYVYMYMCIYIYIEREREMFCLQRDLLGTPVKLLLSSQKCQGEKQLRIYFRGGLNMAGMPKLGSSP